MRTSTLALAVLALAACRPDPGLPDYSEMDALLDAGTDVGFLPGPSPYVPGVRRLAFGIFYEGGASERLDLSDPSRHYYIFSSTYVDTIATDRVEGNASNKLTISGGSPGWWGGGLIWDTPVDLSSWTTLHLSLKSSDVGMAEVEVRMAHGTGAAPTTTGVRATAYGYANDGAWHHLAIPLSAFRTAGVDLAKCRGPLGFGSPVGTVVHAGEALLLDNVYVE